MAKEMPAFFRELLEGGYIGREQVHALPDGFTALSKSLSQLLEAAGITEFLDSAGRSLPCASFFDDWFLYALQAGEQTVYSLFKLREQERDGAGDAPADGDTPGVTVCFIEFSVERLRACLAQPTAQNSAALNKEINRVVASRGQRHHRLLRDYFRRPESEGAYLVAALYVRQLLSFGQEGVLPVPDHYRSLYGRRGHSPKADRLPRFIEALNGEAGFTVCDHERIYLRPCDPVYRALLATHSGNTCCCSFAAEVEYHARFLTGLARLPLPFLGSVYESAIRADMTVEDKEFEGPAPFYRQDSAIVRRQRALHGDRSLADWVGSLGEEEH